MLGKSNEMLSPKKLKIDGEVNSVALVDNYYCYYQDFYRGDDEESMVMDWKFYAYNLLTDEIYELGTIQNFEAGLNSYACLDNKIYFTLGCTDEDRDMLNVHYQIDLKQRSLQILRADEKNKFNPLVSSIAVNKHQYIEFEVEGLEEGYRYSIIINDSEGNRKEIISKEDNRIQEVGDLLTCVSVDNNIIYTVEYYRGNDDTEQFLCSYNLDGTQLSKEAIPEVDELLDKPDQFTGESDALWEMQAFQDYLFFRTLNRKALILKKEGSSYKRIDSLSMDNMEYLQSVSNREAEQNEFLFFNRLDEEFYKLYGDSGKSEKLNLNTEGINFGVYEENKLVYTTNANEVYFVEF